jgi:hypothetical protein
MADSASKAGTTIINSEDSFQSVRPKYRAPNDPLAIEITAPRPKQSLSHQSAANRAKQITKDKP